MKTLTRFIITMLITGVSFVYAQDVRFYSIFINNSSKTIQIERNDMPIKWDNEGWCDYGTDWNLNMIYPNSVLVKCAGTSNNKFLGQFAYKTSVYDKSNNIIKSLYSRYSVNANKYPAEFCITTVTCFRINDETGDKKSGLAIYTFDDKGVAVTFLQTPGHGFFGKIYDNADYNFMLDSYSCRDGNYGRNSESGGCSTYINYN